MTYRVAAIDVHKKVLMVVVATTAAETNDPGAEALEYECRRFGAGHQERQHLTAWLGERGVMEVVMESTAQYWKPVWLDLEPHFPKLHLAQAGSNRAPKGRKNDFRDAKRLVRRLVAGELMLSFVPDPEQRMWRVATRGRYQLVRERVRLQNQVESLLEEARIKLSSVISDLFGASGLRILSQLAEGKTDPAALAQLGDKRLSCSRAELEDALRGSPHPMQLQILGLWLERLEMIDQQLKKVDELIAQHLQQHQKAVVRVARIPGFGLVSAQQLIAEVGHDAAAFPSPGEFCSWIGVCPGSDVSAEENHNSHSPKGNRFVRRILAEAAQAAVKKEGCRFQQLFRHFLTSLGNYNEALWAVAHAMGRVLWKILHDGVDYIEFGQLSNPRAEKRRRQRLIKALRDLGYSVTLTPSQSSPSTALAS